MHEHRYLQTVVLPQPQIYSRENGKGRPIHNKNKARAKTKRKAIQGQQTNQTAKREPREDYHTKVMTNLGNSKGEFIDT